MDLYKNKNLTIDYKKPYKNEIKLQAELYYLFKQIKSIECVLEYKYKRCRFDAVLVKNNKIICIIEIKDRKTKKAKETIKQVAKYNEIGVPVAYLINMQDIYDFFNIIKRKHL